VFVIATANNVQQLPPELLRKGRFDEIFFCDLPTQEERRTIIDIHLRKKKRDPGQFDLDRLAKMTSDYSGAEIEQAVIAALYDAFDSGDDLSTEGLAQSISEIVPLAITMRERIEAMRDWARTRARSASKGVTPRRAPQPARVPSKSWIERHGGDEQKAAEPAEPAGEGNGSSAGSSERKLEL
jgi:SpoVK/Ycf46/Vps4 family AAA+-type ATPase